MRRRGGARLALAGVLALAPVALAPAVIAGQVGAPDAAPRVSTRVEPDTVTVGDRFRTAVFLRLPAGASAELRVPPDPAGRVEVTVGPVLHPPDARAAQHRGVVEMVAWTPGPAGTLAAELRVTFGDGTSRDFAVPLELPHVRSVLPADTAGVRPRPPRGVLPLDRARPFPWWIAVLAAALVAAAGAYWLRRRRPARTAPEVRPDARARALAALDRARDSGAVEAGRLDLFYEMMSGALRSFVAETHPAWGAHLTTPELLERMDRAGAGRGEVAVLAELLGVADLAKFARHPPGAQRARADWARARRWVEGFGAEAAPERVG
jgi:hypothetical protein